MNVSGFTPPRKIGRAWLGFSLTLLVGLTACGGGGGGGGGGSSGPSGPIAGSQFNDCGGAPYCPTMVVIPAGSFTMGSPADEPGRSSNEGPQHQVTFANLFAVGKYPITVGQWEAFVTDTARDPDNYKAKGCLIGTDGETAAPTLNSPVVCVNWKDTQEYVAWLSGKTGKSYRLLSESEWEYAARAGTTTPYPFSATLGTTDVATGDELANYANGTGVYLGLDIYMYTSPVGSFPPNAIGLYDMIGNVSEWTQDCYHNDYTDAPADGSAWVTDCAGTYRVLRNGSWLTGIPQLLRSAFRVASPTLRYNFTGFRVARALP